MSIEQAIQHAVQEAVEPLVAKIDELEALVRGTQPDGDDEDLLDYDAAAAFCHMSRRTLADYATAGKIGSVLVGKRRMFRRRHLREWMRSQETQPVCYRSS